MHNPKMMVLFWWLLLWLGLTH